MSRLQPDASAMGSLASDAPPGKVSYGHCERLVLEHTWLVVDTADVETLVACEESYTLSAKSSMAEYYGHHTVSLDRDWSDGCALLNSGGGSDSGRKNGSDGARLHLDGMKVEDSYGWCRVQGIN
jgi:hypothetical protein